MQLSMRPIGLAILSTLFTAVLLSAAPAHPSETVSLPQMQNGNSGERWMLCQGGFLQEQGNMPLYSQGAMLMMNNQQAQQNNNQARLDGATGEIVIENLVCGDTTFTRHVKFDKATGFYRMIDVFKNTTGKPLDVQFMIQSQFNYNVNSTAVTDAKHKNQTLGCVGNSGNQGWRSIVEVYNGKRSKLTEVSEFGSNSNVAFAKYHLVIPAGKEAAVMHLHGTVATQQAGEEFINALDEKKLMKDVPRELRKIIMNFGGADMSVGELEMLRGDLFDVVEIAGGDQFKGTIKMPTYKLATAFGPVELPENKVIAMFNIGQFKSRQLIVTSDGQVIGGLLEPQTIDVELSSGQTTKIPLSQITRLGYRKRADEPEEWVFNRPFVTLRTGERLFVAMPTAPIPFATRYGVLQVDPKSIASIDWQSDATSVHEMTLTDGTTLAGLYAGDQVELLRDGSTTPFKIEASKIFRWQFKSTDDSTDEAGASLDTGSGDHFVGSITGPLHVETSFDSLQIAGEQIGHLERLKDSPSDVQIKLWDGATLSGRLVETDLPVKTVSGLEIKVPLGLVKEYDQPAPKPPTAVTEQIKLLVKQLNADDWKARDRAQDQLIALGPNAAPMLVELRAAQPAESQQRIDTILKQLAGKEKSNPAPNPQPGGQVMEEMNKN